MIHSLDKPKKEAGCEIILFHSFVAWYFWSMNDKGAHTKSIQVHRYSLTPKSSTKFSVIHKKEWEMFEMRADTFFPG